MNGEVTGIGKSIWTQGGQRIEIDCPESFGVIACNVYLHFKGPTPYALGDKVTITIEPVTPNQHPEKALPQTNEFTNELEKEENNANR